MSESSDAKIMLEQLINKPCIGIEIASETLTISFPNGFIEVSGEDFELYVELARQPN